MFKSISRIRTSTLEINFFFSDSKYLLPGINVNSETIILGSKSRQSYNSGLAVYMGGCQVYFQTKFCMVIGIDMSVRSEQGLHFAYRNFYKKYS